MLIGYLSCGDRTMPDSLHSLHLNPMHRPLVRRLVTALIVATIAGLAGAADPLVLREAVNGLLNGEGKLWLTDLAEYAGSGYGGESTHIVRLDFRASGVNTPSGSPTVPNGSHVENYSAYAGQFVGVDAAYASMLTKNGAPLSGGLTSNGVTMFLCAPGDTFQFRTSGAAIRNVSMRIERNIGYDVVSGGGSRTHYEEQISETYRAALNVARRDVEMVSIDSRKVYGQPNLDGELPADPNAELRNPNFLNWSYRGGLFLGNAVGRDASGTARIQGWVPAANFTNLLMSSLTVRALGCPTGYAAPTVQAYVPSASDPNLATTAPTVTWATAWNLGSAAPLGPPLGVGAIPMGEYLHFRRDGDLARIGLALADESAATSGGSPYWLYFANAVYEADFPLPDSRPRVWTVDLTAVTVNP